MTSALLLREARKRAGLTQRQLAERLGVAQPQVARWESGRAAPSFERLQAVLAVCGLDLEISLAPRDEDTRRMLAVQATRTPDELIDELTAVAALSGSTSSPLGHASPDLCVAPSVGRSCNEGSNPISHVSAGV